MDPYPTLATSTGMTEVSVTTTASGGSDTWNVVGTTGGPPQCHVEGLSEVGRGEVHRETRYGCGHGWPRGRGWLRLRMLQLWRCR